MLVACGSAPCVEAPMVGADASRAAAVDCGESWHVDRASWEARYPILLPELTTSVPRAWEEFSGRPVHVDERAAASCRIVAVDAGDPRLAGHAGVYRKETGDLLVAPSLVPACVGGLAWVPCTANVVLHEMGHAHGLRDLAPDAPGIMNPERMAQTWSDADRRECVAVGACK